MTTTSTFVTLARHRHAWSLPPLMLAFLASACGDAGTAALGENSAALASGPSGQSAMPPNLRDLRAARHGARIGAPATQSQDEPPVPGGLGIGVTYEFGKLGSTQSATLDTKMIVYPNGVGDLDQFLFTTSTNRSEKNVEVVGIYNAGGTGDLGVFDWSCSPDFPCAGGLDGPAWVWVQPFRNDPCHYGPEDNGTGRVHDVLRYRNTTEFSAGLWHNRVNVYNRCFSSWDTIYTHDFGTQIDCNTTGCMWWGPILETFFPAGDPNWPIPELGFFSTTLEHDGVTSHLGDDETDWVAPAPTWNTCYRTPNSAWSASVGAFCPAVSENFASSAGSFTPLNGTWAVTGGTYQITTAQTGSSTRLNNVAVHGTWTPGDFTLSATGKATSTGGSTDNFAILFDWQGPDDYYFASFSETNSSSLSGIFKVVGGVQTQLADITGAITPGTTYTIRIERSDASIKVFRNNALQASASDATFTSGQVGFGSRNSRATFDNLVVNTTKISEHFATDNARFGLFGGTWGVSGGKYAVTTPDTTPTNLLNNVSIHNWPLYGDFTLTASAKATSTSGSSDNFALVFGWIDPNNYYYARFDESTDVYRKGIFRVINGNPTQLAFIYSSITPNTTYDIKIERIGSSIRVYRNGALEAETPDTALVDGKIGVGTKDGRATFDDLVAY
jgi:hypothetical protein